MQPRRAEGMFRGSAQARNSPGSLPPSGAAPANTEGGGTRQSLPRLGKGPRCPSPLPERSPAPEPGNRRLPGIPASLANPSARPPSPRAHQGSGAIALSPPAFGHFLLAAADYGGPRGSHPAVRPGRDRNLPFPPVRVRCGLQGHVPTGLKCHPDQEHLIFPLGCTVLIQAINTQEQNFLHGHSNNVSCVAISKSGLYLASGQVTFMGFKADIILWDYKKRELIARLSLHKGKIEALAFSPNDLYLVSLGGPDDGSVVVWNIAKREAICGSPAAGLNVGNATTVIFSRCRDKMFVTAGNGTIRVWELDLPNRKIWPTECQTGQMKRIVMCITIAVDDSFFYLGTTTGDILKMNPRTKLLADTGPAKDKFSLGVSTIKCLKMGGLLVGSGAGLLVFCKSPSYKPIKKIQLQGGITSITLRGEGHHFFVGTEESHIYRVNFTDFKETLIATCHFEAVQDIVFPFGTAELFATCAKKDIRVWHTLSNRELLRITVPNMTCHGIDFMRDGKSIISAWDDGRIRAFAPETGRLMYVINNAHRIGVTAIATTSDCKRVISGGGEGEVRVWQIGCQTQKLEEALKEHKSSVSCIRVKNNNLECVTASTDGTCIIWDLVRLRRNQMILANTLFQCVCYHPEEFQIITSGTDRKIAYWEVFDGSVIRELEGSLSGSINGMDITTEGVHFVTGGNDHLVKVWDYNGGEVTHVGVGHSGNITRIRISPGNQYIVSVSADGAVLRWKYPFTS
ncbi:cilia- and flagella-associated protein 52 isoform X1 [Acinonyx jubatus]|uniref:Cilia- and flagella-associated protein 52 n=1 Tax=Acinonyx jubatus TaxID=32536 RepID=A0ABM3P7T9_ACIJB|nr:cilia- and flagella-associated protein 52 isoform X1 [Acinonyx jubatus]